MLHQQDQTLSKSLLTVRQALKELLGILEFRQRTCLVTMKCQQNLIFGRQKHSRNAAVRLGDDPQLVTLRRVIG